MKRVILSNRVLLSLIVSLHVSLIVSAQTFDFTLRAFPETCPGNGRIEIFPTGGSGDYSYALSNQCNNRIIPSSEPQFSGLTPCIYEVTVLDKNNNESIRENIEIVGEYERMRLTTEMENCLVNVLVEGGSGTYEFYSSNTGNTNSYIPNTPITSNEFELGDRDNLYIQVIDGCGESRTTNAAFTGVFVYDYAISSVNNGVTINPIGGQGPYSAQITNIKGTFQKSGESVFFSFEEIGCSNDIVITDICGGRTEDSFEREPKGSLTCVNFNEGTAEVEPTEGSAPFVFSVVTGAGTFTSTTGIFEGLPPNSSIYNFYIEDACGTRELIRYTTRHRPVLEPANTCLDQSLTVGFGRQCGGPINLPISYSCLTCPSSQTQLMENYSDLITFNGQNIGTWGFTFTDACGDSVTCRDEYILEAIKACDSILVTVINQFNCDNGVSTRRVVEDAGAIFTLLDDSGGILEEFNTTGVFHGLGPGNYEVIGVFECDSVSSTATIGEEEVVDPYFETSVRVREVNGKCQIVYSIDLTKGQGPYILTGGPAGNYYQVFNNYKQDNCRFYQINNLLPGTYELTSMSRCGTRTITLPEPAFELIAEWETSCPGGGIISVEGASGLEDWVAWFESFDLNMDFEEYNTVGGYRIDTGSLRESTGERTFYNQSFGSRMVYLYAFGNSSCPVDSQEVFIPPYEEMEFNILGGVACDGESTSDLYFTVDGGSEPYTLTGLTENGDQTFLLDSIKNFQLNNIPLGSYVYRVEDECGVALTQLVNVNRFGDSIQTSFSCDNTILLEVDNLPLEFKWFDEQGNLVSDSFYFQANNLDTTQFFRTEIISTNCEIERSLTLFPKEIIPSVTIISAEGKQAICEEGNLELIADTRASSIVWSTGETSRSILISEVGEYKVTVTNEYGCTFSDQIEIVKLPNPRPTVIGNNGLCPGDSIELTLNQPYNEVFWNGASSSAESWVIGQPGNYEVLVIDSFGCEGTLIFEVLALEVPQFGVIVDSLICPGETTNALISPTLPNWGYSWSNGLNSKSVDLEAGDYSLTVTNEDGCRAIDTLSIQSRPSVSVNLQGDQTLCLGDTAKLEFRIDGGYAPVSIVLTNDLGGTETLSSLRGDTIYSIFPNRDVNFSISHGKVDTDNCTIDYSGLASIIVSKIEVSSQVDSISCPGDTDGKIELFPESRYLPLNFNWEDGSNEFIRSGLGPGVYEFEIRNAFNCLLRDSVILKDPLEIEMDLLARDPVCYDSLNGIIELRSINGGQGTKEIFWQEQGPYFLPFLQKDLGEGWYNLTVVDENNCEVDTSVFLNRPLKLELQLGEDQNIRLGESIRLNPVFNFNDIGKIEWQINGDVPLDITPSLHLPTKDPLTSNSLIKLLLQNSVGCIVEDEVYIKVDKTNLIKVPNVFSPNGDGTNDDFFPQGGKGVETIEAFEIFDRWGNLVFSQTLPVRLNDPSLSWNGRLLQKSLPTGTYVWRILFKSIDGHLIDMNGDVLLLK